MGCILAKKKEERVYTPEQKEFMRVDTDGNGFVSAADLCHAGYDEADVEQAMQGREELNLAINLLRAQ